MPVPSLVQWTLRASPQAAFTVEFSDVSWRHAPIGPAHTSAGDDMDWRTTAEEFPSLAREIWIPQPSAESISNPFHTCRTWPLAPDTVAMPELPSMFSVNRIWFGPVHFNQVAEAFIPGVRLRASPPLTGTTKMSPPVEPWSLMMPLM